KSSDVGVAKSFSDVSMELKGSGFTMGTPDYMSPEQVNGDDLDFKADMYSLGLVLYELVTGTRAFEGSVMEVLNRQLTEMPPRASTQNSSISESCSGVIDRMIQKAAADRYHTWGACSDALKLVIASTVCDVDVLGKSSLSMPTNDDLVNASGIILDDDSLKEGTVEVREFKAVEAGFIIGNGYEIDRKIGDGAMGEIFLAVDEEKDRLVQVKLLSPSLIGDREKVERLLQEMDITSSLSHPNLLSVIEGGEDNGRYYLVTEYEDGITLEDYLGRYAPLDERDALDFLVQISQVLSYAWHEKKLLHREIKPSNILVNEDTKQVKLTDFGVAKSLEGDSLNLTGVGFTIGSPEYMSPEQVRGDEDIDSRSDMYAVGLVLYEALAGRKPFQAESVMALMNMQMTEQHKSLRNINPKVSKPCSDLVDRLLAKNRDQRYSTWSEMLKAMKKARAGEAVTQIDLSNTLPRDGVAFPAQQTAASPGFQRTRTGSHLDVLPPIEKRGRSNMKLWLVVSVAVLILLIILLLNN
ncbi:MAG: protein kinase, partial [Lentisphaeraceae bacterium]|nr:protein kinase [Lentisphaeraceae bacterium]